MLLVDLLALLGIVSTGRTRYVSGLGEDASPGDEPHLPYRTIERALEDALLSPDEQLVIQLQGTDPFVESLTLPSNVTIRGPGAITASAPGPAITIAGTEQTMKTGVVLEDLELQGTGSYQGLGGAVLVERANGVRLERCRLLDSVAGRGGGIAIVSSRAVALRDCAVRGNTARGAIPAVDANPAINGVAFPVGDGHGGGVYLRDTDAEISGCVISANRAIYAGGGIAVSNVDRRSAPVHIVDCEITANQVAHGPLAALGPTWTAHAPEPRDDLGDPLRPLVQLMDTLTNDVEALERLEERILANSHGMKYVSGMGGGISLHHTRQATTIRGCNIGLTNAGTPAPNLARRGGGIHLYTGSYPTIDDCVIAFNGASGDGGGLGADYFDPFVPGTAPQMGITPETKVPRQPIVLTNTRFRHNQAIEDGGGVYATGNAQPRITGGQFVGNRAGEHGGAIRTTYATQLEATGVDFFFNEANVVLTDATGDLEGGGAISARNSDTLVDRCVFDGNTARDFAGGAIYYRSGFEGGVGWQMTWPPFDFITDEHGMFDEIQESAFLYHRRVLRVINCSGGGNQATGPRGAGGFLYALRNPLTDADGKILGGQEPMWISIEGPATAVHGSVSEYDRGAAIGKRKRGAVTIELSGRTNAAGVPEDRVSIGREVPLGAIAGSVPSPDGRGLLIMPSEHAPLDLTFATFPGGPFAFGPQPTIQSLDQQVFRTTGGNRRLAITGATFEAGMRVLVGAVAATVVSETATTIVADLPPLDPGTHDLVVLLGSGAEAIRLQAITVPTPPLILSLSKSSGRPGEPILLRGVGLPLGTRVDFLFGAVELEVAVTQTAENRLTFNVAPQAPGFSEADIRVTTPLGQIDMTSPAEPFRYLPAP